MTSTELIKDMLERQKAYDEEVFKKHNVDYVSKSQLESALFDELGELMHAQKSDWCWWKFTQEPKDEVKVFEAYDDMVLIKQALIERDRKIYGLQQHTRNLEDKLGRIGGYHYGNPKQ